MIFFLAFRNLIRNSKNTLIITLLIMIMTALFFVGNTILASSHNGLKGTYVHNFTGDIVIKVKSDVSMSIFGANTPVIGEFFSIPVLKYYSQIISYVEECRDIHSYTSQVTGAAVVDIHNSRYNGIIFGIEPETYFPFFDGITVRQGRFLHPGERGAMITTEYARLIERDSQQKLSIGDPILLSTIGRTGFKIREVPIIGIYTYSGSQIIPDSFVLTDPYTLRALNSILVGTSSDEPIKNDAVDILTDDPDHLFDEGTIPESTKDILNDNPDTLFDEEESSGDSFSDESILIEDIHALFESGNDNVAGNDESTSMEDPIPTGGGTQFQPGEGSWNFLILRLKEGSTDVSVLKKLNSFLPSYNAEAVDWRTAAGPSALLALLLGYIFNGGFLLVMTAGLIGIINILLISVFRRTREIGTLRAIGARDFYIIRLIFTENLLLSFTAGIAGILLGSIVMFIVNKTGIPLTNSMLASLMGQKVLFIHYSVPFVFISLGTSLGLGFISSLYPVQKALHIEPAIAVSKG